MQFEVKVTARAKRPEVKRSPEGMLLIKVTEPAEGGRANSAVIEALAQYFKIPKQNITIERGLASRRKLIKIVERS